MILFTFLVGVWFGLFIAALMFIASMKGGRNDT